MGREMWNYAKLGVLGASANKFADLIGVLVDGSHSGWIVERHCAYNLYFTRKHSKVRDACSRVRGDLPSHNIASTWLNAASHDAAYLQTEMEWSALYPQRYAR
jgi:hypothetical protein